MNTGVGCPSLNGVTSTTTLTPALAAVLENFIASELATSNPSFVRSFDRTLLNLPNHGFAQLFGPSFGTSAPAPLGLNDFAVEPLSSDRSLASDVVSACGQAVVAASWRIVFCDGGTPVQACDPGITTTELVIDRSETWMVWYLGSGVQ
jgi:hypothetical protein